MLFSKIMHMGLMALGVVALAMPEAASSGQLSTLTASANSVEATSSVDLGPPKQPKIIPTPPSTMIPTFTSGISPTSTRAWALSSINGTAPDEHDPDSVSYAAACSDIPISTCRSHGYYYSCDSRGYLYWTGPSGLYPECYGRGSGGSCFCQIRGCKVNDPNPC